MYRGPKRYKKGLASVIKHPRAEIKWKNFPFSAGTTDFYLTVTDIDTGGEYDKRIANNIHAMNLQVQFRSIGTTTVYGAFRVMVVQSKQGMLSGSGGSGDAPSFDTEANHNAYKVLYDQAYTYKTGADDQSQIVQFNAKINQAIRYKVESGVVYTCDKPIYLWIISSTPGVATSQHYGRAQLYFSDV